MSHRGAIKMINDLLENKWTWGSWKTKATKGKLASFCIGKTLCSSIWPSYPVLWLHTQRFGQRAFSHFRQTMHRGAFKLIVGKAEAFPRKGSRGKGATSIKRPLQRISAGGRCVVKFSLNDATTITCGNIKFNNIVAKSKQAIHNDILCYPEYRCLVTQRKKGRRCF